MPPAATSAPLGEARQRLLDRPAALALVLVLLALVPRIAFALEGESIAVIRSPTPGMDVDVNWNAALQLRRGQPEEANLELMASSAPLHVWWLAALQSVLGEGMLACRVAVAIISSLRYALLFLVALRVAGKTWPAALATALLALTPALVYFDAVLLKAATDLTLLAILLVVLTGPRPGSQPGRIAFGLGLGALLSLCFLSQLNTILYLPVTLAWLLALPRQPWRARLALALPALALFAATFAAFQVHTRTRGVPHAGVNLLLGFHAEADVTYRPLADLPSYPHAHAFLARLGAESAVGRPMSPAQADAWYLAEALGSIRADPGRALGLMARRALAVFNDYEIKGGDQLQWLRLRALSLRMPPVRYGMLLVLGAFGLAALCARGSRHLGALFAGLLLAVTAANCLTMVFSRLRAPTMLLLGVLAAAGIPYLVELARRCARGTPPRARARALIVLVLVGGGAVWLGARPILEGERAGLDRQAEENQRLSVEREQVERELESLRAGPDRELTPQEGGRRAKLLARLWRHSEAFRQARETVRRSPADTNANWLYVRYWAWLGRYEQARHLSEQLRAFDQNAWRAVVEHPAHRFEQEALERFVYAP